MRELPENMSGLSLKQVLINEFQFMSISLVFIVKTSNSRRCSNDYATDQVILMFLKFALYGKLTILSTRVSVIGPYFSLVLTQRSAISHLN